ncbi:hypothetical protein [Natrononativus amylolyticus]|uniref:TackOD1 domain-containing metal-binding protein n=1 Tax=Natrononativus amylolyticus TaxID=2963434 RepID=UPI0020CB8A0F|nr:hypothetical protein [Natrononativus amylolyticus]
MVAPDRLQLLVDLSNGATEEYTPTIDEETGEVSYPDARRIVGEEDREALEALADHDLLEMEFEEKVYLCPSCDAEGMQYTTVCSHCESPYAVETELLFHPTCETTRPREEFIDDEGFSCPTCAESVPGDELHGSWGYECRDCGECTDAPEHRLSCRSCGRLAALEDGGERVLCRYGLSATGEGWLETQLGAREAIRSALDARGFETRTDEPVTTDGGADHVHVHVYGEDPLLDRVVVADVHDRATLEDVEWLRAASTGANAILVTTSGTIDERAATLARKEGIQILSVGDDGELRREVDVTDETPGPTLIQRLTSAVSQ